MKIEEEEEKGEDLKDCKIPKESSTIAHDQFDFLTMIPDKVESNQLKNMNLSNKKLKLYVDLQQPIINTNFRAPKILEKMMTQNLKINSSPRPSCFTDQKDIFNAKRSVSVKKIRSIGLEETNYKTVYHSI